MNNYKIKFKNGRTTTICCDSNEELKSDLVDLTKRFNSEIATINDMPTEKLSVGGFLLGTFLGGILGNSVAKSGVKKTAKTISKKAKTTISKTRKGVSEFRSASSKSKKYSGGGGVSKETNIKAFFKNFGFNVEDIQPDEYGNGIEGWIVFYDNKNKYRVIDYSTAKYLMVHDKTTNKTDIIKQSKLFNIDEYSKGGGTKQKQKINKKYTHFAVSKEDGKIADAWETLDDIETLKHYANLDLKDNDHNPKDFNILSAKTLIKRGINPYDSDNWGHFSTRATRYETGGGVQNEYSFQGNTMINGLYQPVYKRDGKYYLKYFNPTRYSFLANESDIKNYRLISMYEDGGMSSATNPNFYVYGIDKDEPKKYQEFVKFISSEKDLVAYLKKYESEKSISFTKVMKVLRNKKETDVSSQFLNKKFADGGMSSMALAGASPQLAIGNEISKRLPATTSAIDKKIAERIYSEKPSMWEDRGLKHYGKGGVLNEYEEEQFKIWKSDGNVSKNADGTYSTQDAQWSNKIKNITELKKYFKKEFFSDSYYAKGGTIGQQITFKHWSGDTKNGTITEDLGEGNFQVSSGFGNVLVNQEDIISTGTKTPERKKMFGFFKGGGSTEEGIDLFEDYKNIPPKVQRILDKYSQGIEDGDYNDLGDAKNELEEIGYTFDYYLDGVPYDLRPIGTKGKVEE